VPLVGDVQSVGAAIAWVAGAQALAWAGSQVAALLVAFAWRRHVGRRIGGVTGDVFGSLVELSTMVVLVGVALAG